MNPKKPLTATIHFARIGKPTRVFNDIFLEDDGTRLKTYTTLLPKHSQKLSRGFQAEKRLKKGQWVTRIAKFLFYHEYFSIMQFFDHAGELLGVYTDIATPLQRVGDGYYLTDLCLDLWLIPNGSLSVLDEDEFEQACLDGLISPQLAQTARQTLERLLAETRTGTFPGWYIL